MASNIKRNKPQIAFQVMADISGDVRSIIDEELPEKMGILPLRNMMLFPGVVASVSLGRDFSKAVVRQALKNDGFIAVLTQVDEDTEVPQVNDLFDYGVAAKVLRLIEHRDGNLTAILQTFGKVSFEGITRHSPIIRGTFKKQEEIHPDLKDPEFVVLSDEIRKQTVEVIRLSDEIRDDAIQAVEQAPDPEYLINFVATNMPFEMFKKYEALTAGSVKERAELLLKEIGRMREYARIKMEVQTRARQDMDQQQREFFLQQQIRVMQQELGDNPGNDDQTSLREKAESLNLSEKMRAYFEKELRKLERIPPQAPDYNVQLNYLETFVSLPWGQKTADNLSINVAKQQLDHDHFGMERVKERILEHLAVYKLQNNSKNPILCLYGAPGVGKTSLGKSIAEALGRKYVRISLGGVHDEAEIRGHRRTYIGAMPGRIIKGLIKAKTDNPVFILDEIDKVVGATHNGDPQSALLEVLDPEQNVSYHDNFLDVDYDLSSVMFIATANNLSTIPAPLLDRMELIEVEGYSTEEKIEIAKRHLIPKEQEKLQLPQPLKFTNSGIERLIEGYTRESGVRQLEKMIQKIFRKRAFEHAMDPEAWKSWKSFKAADAESLLGKPRFSRETYKGQGEIGVVTGLAWTAVGGEILFIETSVSQSKQPVLKTTGNLGDVMKESAMLALEYVRAHASELDIDASLFEKSSIHVHVPEGATPKDGPSAGITIATSIASALSGKKVRTRLAMTGEITLRGRVLPVGGIKEKILAAKRAGIKEIMLSRENEKDILEINERYLGDLKFHYVERVSEVLNYALLS